MIKTHKIRELDFIEPLLIYKKFLRKVGVKHFDNLSVENIKKLFQLSFDDFLSGKVCVDDFAMFCNKLSNILTSSSDEDMKNEKALLHALLCASELRYMVRYPSTMQYYTAQLEDIYSYFGYEE